MRDFFSNAGKVFSSERGVNSVDENLQIGQDAIEAGCQSCRCPSRSLALLVAALATLAG